MEENQESAVQPRQVVKEDLPERTPVSFPDQPRKKNSKKPLFVIFVVLILAGIGAWFIFGKKSTETSDSSLPTPTKTATISTPTPTPTPKTIERKNIDIQVLNGTGIAGEAAFLQTELGKLGYEKIKAGNATKSDYEVTEVGFASSASEDVKNEIIKKLEDIYKTVEVKSSTSISYDVQVIVGYKKGHTPTPSPKPSLSITPTATTSGTPTPTSTPTPTPTP